VENTDIYTKRKITLGSTERKIVDNLYSLPPGQWTTVQDIISNIYEKNEIKNPRVCIMYSLKKLLKKGLIEVKTQTFKPKGRGGLTHKNLYRMNENNRLLVDYLSLNTYIDKKLLKMMFELL